jgi:hypothetical protein
LSLLAEGASNKSIALRLGISVHTVTFHVASLLDKFEAIGRTDAVTGLDAGHDPHISYSSTRQCRERCLIAGAIVHRDGVLNGIKFDHYGAFQLPGLINVRGHSPHYKAPSARLDGRTRQLCVGSKFRGI